MKICMISPSFPPMPGGVSYYVYNLSKELVKRGHQVIVLTRGSMCKPYRDDVDGILVYKIPYLPIYPFHVYLHGYFARHFFKHYENQVDLLHYHIPLPPYIATHLPKIATVHGFPELQTRVISSLSPKKISEKLFSFIVQNIERDIFASVDAMTTVSKSVAQELEYYYDINQEDINVVGNGVDVNFFCPIFKKTNRLSILYAGRLDYKKGLFELVESAKEIIALFPEVSYYIAGTGPLYGDLEKKVKKLGIKDNFVFFGQVSRDRLREIYRKSSVFVLPSYYEGLPNVVLEAMACGLPIIASDVGGLRDIIKNGENGFLLSSPDSKDITEALVKVLSTDSLRDEMGKRSRIEVVNNFSWDVIAEKFLVMYHEILNNGGFFN